jgi:hypothetical protein
MNTSTTNEPTGESKPLPPEPRERLCGTFVIRQSMESWTQAERDAFIAEFGYI